MAQQGKKIDLDDQRRIAQLSQKVRSKAEIAKAVGVSRPTAYKYARDGNAKTNR